ncbi:MAG: hypothetical protein AAF492_24405, partial [Verrucomicrobiota bacterium]
DHRSDPDENRNVVKEHPEVVRDLANRLRAVLVPGPVQLRPRIHSRKGGAKVNTRWVNDHDGRVRVTWINPQGERRNSFELSANEVRPGYSFVGHVFVAESLDGRYHEIITVTDSEGAFRLGLTAGE